MNCVMTRKLRMARHRAASPRLRCLDALQILVVGVVGDHPPIRRALSLFLKEQTFKAVQIVIDKALSTIKPATQLSRRHPCGLPDEQEELLEH